LGLDGPLRPAGARGSAFRPAARDVPQAPLGAPLLLGFAVASIGGPVALVYQLLPDTIGSAAQPSIGLVALLALVLFAFPVAIWLRYSARIASAGGLYAFVEAAAGRTAARVHGAVWIVSYFLYLPATVTFVVYELLPELAPGTRPYRGALEVLLPLGFAVLVLAPLRVALALVGLLAVGQLALLLVLGGLEVANVGFPAGSLATHGNGAAVRAGVATASLLFLCASLPLYLGAEVRGGGRALGRWIAGAAGLVGAYVLFAAVPLASVPAEVRNADLPAYAVASAYSGRALAFVAGTATILSILALVYAEYLALSRLLTAMAAVPLRLGVLAIGAAFLLGDALSLLDPEHAYDWALRPSLAALYLSQLIVFVVYPLFERTRRLTAAAPVALVAAVPLVWGLYLVARDRIAT
jgi:amino acid transporter